VRRFAGRGRAQPGHAQLTGSRKLAAAHAFLVTLLWRGRPLVEACHVQWPRRWKYIPNRRTNGVSFLNAMNRTLPPQRLVLRTGTTPRQVWQGQGKRWDNTKTHERGGGGFIPFFRGVMARAYEGLPPGKSRPACMAHGRDVATSGQTHMGWEVARRHPKLKLSVAELRWLARPRLTAPQPCHRTGRAQRPRLNPPWENPARIVPSQFYAYS